jgi:hypothetical protein
MLASSSALFHSFTYFIGIDKSVPNEFGNYWSFYCIIGYYIALSVFVVCYYDYMKINGEKMVDKKKDEGKTLFEHLGLTGKKSGKNKQIPEWLIESIKWIAIGFIGGMIVDVIFDYSKATIIFPLMIVIIILVKKKKG